MQKMGRLESHHLEPRDRRGEVPESGPKTLLLDTDRRVTTDFFSRLRVVPEIGDQMQIALRDQYHRAAPRKTGEVAHVRQAGDHEPVDVSRYQRIPQRGDARGATLRHLPALEAVWQGRGARAHSRTRRIHR